jgi:SAM-dependent methyltransferase
MTAKTFNKTRHLSFGHQYSKYYDFVYSRKDYGKECGYLERIFWKYSKHPVRDVLDIACGTGGHAILLAKREYSVVGLDISRSMIEVAREKAKTGHIPRKPRFRVGDMRRLAAREKYDVCICMFASIGYLHSPQEVRKTFARVWSALRPEGLFVLDYWNGAAVLRTGPSERKRTLKEGSLRIERLSSPIHNVRNHTVAAGIETVVTREGRQVERFREVHEVRYFWPDEVRSLLEKSGFTVVSTHPFLKLKSSPSTNDWNLTAVARKP